MANTGPPHLSVGIHRRDDFQLTSHAPLTTTIFVTAETNIAQGAASKNVSAATFFARLRLGVWMNCWV